MNTSRIKYQIDNYNHQQNDAISGGGRVFSMKIDNMFNCSGREIRLENIDAARYCRVHGRQTSNVRALHSLTDANANGKKTKLRRN